MIDPAPMKIIWFYRRWQPCYTALQEQMTIEFIEGIPSNINRDDFFDASIPTLFIIDDLMKEATQNADICNLFTEGSHHRNLSVICVLQNLYYKGKENRTMSLNSQYIVLFKNPRDQQQVAVLGRQMYPYRSQYFIDEYKNATDKPFSYLFIDLKQSTNEGQRLQNNIFNTLSPNKRLCNSGKVQSPLSSRKDNTVKVTDREDLLKPHVDMTEKTPLIEMRKSCMDCGVMFNTPLDVERHIKRGCPEADSDDDELPSKRYKSDEDHESAFDSLIDAAYNKYDDYYEDKVTHLMKDGMKQRRAEHEASAALRPKYRKALVKGYTKLLDKMYELKFNTTHQKVIEDIEDYMDDGETFRKALALSLRNNRHLLDEVLDKEETDTEDESESETDSGDESESEREDTDEEHST